MNHNRLIVLIFFSLTAIQLLAQYPGSTTNPPNTGTNPTSFQISTSDASDTLPIIFTKRNQTDQYVYEPKATVTDKSHQFDLSRTLPIDYLHLGNQGSAAWAIEQQMNTDIEYDFGFKQYDPYKKQPDSLKYFNLKKPLSDLYFSPKGQGNFVVKALFASSFANDIDFTLDYHRINEDGFYTNQKTKSTSVSAGLYFGKHPKLKTYIEFHANNHNEEQNGGVSDTTLFDEMFNSNRFNIPIYLNNASTRHESFTYVFQENVLLNPQANLFNSELILESKYEHGYYRFFDNQIEDSERLIYEQFVVDDRGIRTLVNFNKFKNNFTLRTKLKESLSLDLGIKYHLIKIEDALKNTRLNNLIAYGKIKLNITNDILLKGDLDLGVGNNAGTLGLKSEISLPWKKVLAFKGGFDFSRLNPSYLSENLVITGLDYWNNDFAKPIHSQLWASLEIPKANTKITLAQGITDNAIYFDSLQTFKQLENVYTYTKLKINNTLKLGPLHLDHSILLQEFNENIYGLPNLFIDQKLYFEFKLFKDNLDTQLGVEHRFMPASNMIKFQPVIGEFYPIEDERSALPRLDAFSLFNISNFNFLVRAENIYDLFSNQIRYPIEVYPAYDFHIRISAGWLIRN